MRWLARASLLCDPTSSRTRFASVSPSLLAGADDLVIDCEAIELDMRRHRLILAERPLRSREVIASGCEHDGERATTQA